MEKKLIICGCSITHGAETVNGFMHADNIKNSYSNHIASWLGLDLINVALSGGSNEYIFHSLLEEINKIEATDIHSVVAAWTAVGRLHWVNKGRHWFFIPGWASSMKNLYDWEYHQHHSKAVYITGDSDDILETLHDQHQFFIDNYLDDLSYLKKKLDNFKSALQTYCDHKKIKFISIDIFDEWRMGRHPTAQEHLNLAKEFYKKFYNTENA
jgi:hypothetical protein